MKDDMDNLDALIDGALKGYVEQDPPLGMDRRVMGRVHAAPRLWRIWLPAATVFAGACLLLMISRNTPLPPQPRQTSHVQATAVTLPPLPAPVEVSAVQPKRRSLRHKLSKPEPLSQGERALLSFLANDPEHAHKVLREALVAMDRPITIEALRIEPLEAAGTEVQLKETSQ